MNVLHIEGAKHNVRVNTLVPAAATRMTESLLAPEAAQDPRTGDVQPRDAGPKNLIIGTMECIINPGHGTALKIIP